MQLQKLLEVHRVLLEEIVHLDHRQGNGGALHLLVNLGFVAAQVFNAVLFERRVAIVQVHRLDKLFERYFSGDFADEVVDHVADLLVGEAALQAVVVELHQCLVELLVAEGLLIGRGFVALNELLRAQTLLRDLTANLNDEVLSLA